MLARTRSGRRVRAAGVPYAPAAPTAAPPAEPVPRWAAARRRAIAWLLVLHGLMHASVGVWASDLGPTWYVTTAWWIAMAGFVGAGFGLLGLVGLRPRWQPLVAVATLASVALFATHGRSSSAAPSTWSCS
jgi:hypothetical protein